MMRIFRSDRRKITPIKRFFVTLLVGLGFRGTSVAKATGVPLSTVYRYRNKLK